MYEVNLRVERDIAVEYRAWLQEHIARMLELPGFLDAELFEVEADDAGSHLSLCTQYRLRDAASLEAYLREHAPHMRAEGTARFGDRFTAARRVLRPVDAVS